MSEVKVSIASWLKITKLRDEFNALTKEEQEAYLELTRQNMQPKVQEIEEPYDHIKDAEFRLCSQYDLTKLAVTGDLEEVTTLLGAIGHLQHNRNDVLILLRHLTQSSDRLGRRNNLSYNKRLKRFEIHIGNQVYWATSLHKAIEQASFDFNNSVSK